MGGNIRILTTTSSDLHGDAPQEFLIPDVKSNPNVFIGLTTGREYREAAPRFVTYPPVTADDLLKAYKKFRKVRWLETFPTLARLWEFVDALESIPFEEGLAVGFDKEGVLRKTTPIVAPPKRWRKLSDEARAGYAEIFRLSGGGLAAFAEKTLPTLKNYDDSEDYGTTLNYLVEKLDAKNRLLFVSLDWKEEFDWARTRLLQAVSLNHGVSLSTTHAHPYQSVAEPGSFRALEAEIVEQGLELTFVDTEGDEYVFLVNKASDREALRKAILAIGYRAKTVVELEKERAHS